MDLRIFAYQAMLYLFLAGNMSAQESNDVSVKKVIINKIPPAGDLFLLKQTEIEIHQADFERAVFKDEIGYPRIDFNKFNIDKQGHIIKSYKAVILENKYIRLTLIPGKGKPYSMIYKVTGNEEFYIPPVAQMHKSQNLGWWFIMGGVEYTLPNDEHGDTWAADWDWEVTENSPVKKTVRMSVNELRHGLKESIDISVYPDKAYYEADIFITNPTDTIIHFQHWINPMWVPGGGADGLTANTEFIIPTREVYATERDFNKWMLSFSKEGCRLQPYENNPMRVFKNWKYYGDLLAWKLEHGFYSAFSHEKGEGIVRVFPLEMNPGCNIWTWGFEPGIQNMLLFSGREKHNGYVEMWGGITHGFNRYFSLSPAKSISWKEYMYPYINTKGLHYANNDFAVTFLKTGDGSYEVNFCPGGEVKGIVLKVKSVSGKSVYLDVNIESLFPNRDIAGFPFKTPEKDLELIIYKDSKEVIRLKPLEPSTF